MLATIIIEYYRSSEMTEISECLDDICSPYDNYGWASTGIYCFWDVYTKEILYIGLAVDLAQRFRQHNGLLKMNSASCKYEYIKNYFNDNEYLGYTIFVQSPLSQPIMNKILSKHNRDDVDFVEAAYKLQDELGYKEVRLIEGNLIESHKRINGNKPKWNKIGGSIEGQKYIYSGEKLLELFTLKKDDFIVARSSLREISSNPTYETYENFLHSIRINIFRFGIGYDEEFYKNYYDVNTRDRIILDKYHKKYLRLLF